MAENEGTSAMTNASGLPRSRLRPPAASKLKRPMAASVTQNEDEKQTAPKKIRGNAGSAVPPAKLSKVTKSTRRSLCRVRNSHGSVTSAKKKKALNSAANAATTKKKQSALSSTTGKVATSKSKTAVTSKQNQTLPNTSNAVNDSTVPKKAKRPPWDIKGKLADMTEQFERQHAELAEHKHKTKILDDILRRLDVLEGEKQAIQVENTGQMGEISRLRSELSNNESELRSLRERLRVLTMDLDERNTELRKMRLENQDLDVRFHEQEVKSKDMTQKLQCLEEKYSISQNTNEKYEQDIKEYEIERKHLLNEVIELKGNIRVFCRVRPHINDESPPHHITYDGQQEKSISIANGEKANSYTFDKVFKCVASQSDVFEELSQLVTSSLDGYNVCVFAYGQTGSGKTYTMEGPDDMSDETCGVIPRAMKQVFSNSKEREKFGWEFTFHVEQLEIYCENVQDLLRPKNTAASKLEIRTKKPSGQAGINVPELTSHKVETYDQVKKLLSVSKRRRATAATNANDYSSRSHSVFILRISASNTETGHKTESALNLIDLAGSERCGSNGATGVRFVEGTKINGSLTVLSSVITALTKKDSHIPFRSSKLTLLLSDCLGGNSKTLMIVNINPSPPATSESINTLRFATMVNQCNIGTAQKVVKF